MWHKFHNQHLTTRWQYKSILFIRSNDPCRALRATILCISRSSYNPLTGGLLLPRGHSRSIQIISVSLARCDQV